MRGSSYLVAVCYAFLYYLLLSRYPYSFNASVYTVKQYALLSIGLAFFIPGAFRVIKAQHADDLNLAYFLACTGLLLLFAFSESYSYSNEHFAIYLALFLTLPPLLSRPRQILAGVWAGIFLFFIIEVVLVIKQQAEGKALWGTYRNPNVISCYFVVNLPLFYHMAFERFNTGWANKHAVRYLRTILFLSGCGYILFVCVHNRTRTAIIGFFFILLLFLWERSKSAANALFKNKRSVIFRGIAFSMLLAGVCYKSFIYFKDLKYGSFQGRMLMWDICLRKIDTWGLTGIGFGRTPLFYPGWQADYFRDHNLLADNRYLFAGESYIIYNDILQLVAEFGAVGSTLLCLIIYCFFRKKTRNKSTGNMAKATMAIILLCAFSNYVLQTTSIMFVLFLSIVTLAGDWEFAPVTFRRGRTFSRLLAIGCLLIILPLVFKVAAKDYALWKIEKYGGIATYESAYRLLEDDGKYLAQLGIVMENENRLDEAIRYFEESRKYNLSYNSLFSLAHCYSNKGDYARGIACFSFLANFVPHRFAPKFELLKLYIITNKKEEGRKLAELILQMEEKVPSFEVKEIKYHTKEILDSLHRSGSFPDKIN